MVEPSLKQILLLQAKVVILGCQGVGKTSFINRYVGNLFEQHTPPTIGASFFTCRVRIDNYDLELLIWDTAGQERFRSMAPMYYRNANAGILMYDITSYSSYESMKEWVTELKVRLEESIIMCVIGNKLDMNAHRQVGFKEASDYAISIGALYHESSALNSKGVESAFLDIAQELINANRRLKENHKNSVYQGGSVIRVSDKQGCEDGEEEKSFLCC